MQICLWRIVRVPSFTSQVTLKFSWSHVDIIFMINASNPSGSTIIILLIS